MLQDSFMFFLQSVKVPSHLNSGHLQVAKIKAITWVAFTRLNAPHTASLGQHLPRFKQDAACIEKAQDRTCGKLKNFFQFWVSLTNTTLWRVGAGASAA